MGLMRCCVLALFVVLAGGACALIDAFGGGDGGVAPVDGELVCDNESICTCEGAPDETVTCVGDCSCDDENQLVCEDIAVICSLLFVDGCSNGYCRCAANGGSCDCQADASTCIAEDDAVVDTFDPNGCTGGCTCQATGPLGSCRCAADGCLFSTRGVTCAEDSVCTNASRAQSAGCRAAVGPGEGCRQGEECFELGDANNVRSYCFLIRDVAGCPPNLDAATVRQRGISRDVCVRQIASTASCVDRSCTDGF